MPIPDLEHFVQQVARNCDISDARFAGGFSVCGLALRLHDLYKWEHHLAPWEEHDPGRVLDWIGLRETRWEELVDETFAPIEIQGRAYDAFDNEGINAAVRPSGLFYSAGYAYELKPVFLLACLERESDIDGVRIAWLGRELVRDLLTVPALSRENTIFYRSGTAAHDLWNRMTYLRKSARPALRFALEACGVPGDDARTLRDHFPALLAAQQTIYIGHELGEIRDRSLDREDWRRMVADISATPLERLARTVKDLLADVGPFGTLARIVEERNETAMGFYAAFCEGLHRAMFPALTPAFEAFAATRNWRRIVDAAQIGHRTACRLAEDIFRLHDQGKNKYGRAWMIETAGRIIRELTEGGKYRPPEE